MCQILFILILLTGGPEFNTPETNDIDSAYNVSQVNSGRLEFEARANNDAYIVLSKDPNDDVPAGIIHLIIGGWANNRNAIYQSHVEVANFAQVATYSNYEYRRFWAEWDAYSVRVSFRKPDFNLRLQSISEYTT